MHSFNNYKRILALITIFTLLAANASLTWAEDADSTTTGSNISAESEAVTEGSSDSKDKSETANDQKLDVKIEQSTETETESARNEDVIQDRGSSDEMSAGNEGNTLDTDTSEMDNTNYSIKTSFPAVGNKAVSTAAARQNISTKLAISSPPTGTVVYKNTVTVNAKLTNENGDPVQGQPVSIKATGNGYSRYSEEKNTDANGEVTLEVRNLDVGTWSINVLHNADVSSDNTIVYGASDAYIDVEIRPESEDPENTAVAADAPTKVQILSLRQGGDDGSRLYVKTLATDDNGKVPENIAYNYKVFLYAKYNASDPKKGYSWITNSEGTTEGNILFVTSGSTVPAVSYDYDLYAVLYDENNNKIAESEHMTVTSVKPTFNKTTPVITTTSSIEDQATGTITVGSAGDFARIAYYKYGSSAVQQVEGNVITGLAAGKYYVYSPYYRDGDTFYITSSKPEVTVGERALERYNVTLNTDGHAYWWSGNSKYTISKTFEIKEGDELEYTVRANDDYVSDWINGDVTWDPKENADVEIIKTDDTEWTVKITNITGDVTLSATGKEKPILKYKVTASGDDNASWSKSEVELLPGRGTTLYVKPKDSSTHYISEVKADPSDNAEITFNESTGEVTVSNVTGDVTLTATSVEKPVPKTLEVISTTFSDKGNYSEDNPAVQVTYKVKVLDQFGNIVPKTAVYFKDDESEVSYTQSRSTDTDGIAEFTYSYGISTESGDTRADYTALFSLNNKFSDITADEIIHLVLQQKKDLVLYEDQIIGTKPGENDGKVINVPEGYEIWTGEVHQGAIVIGSGAWVPATDGEFTGLSAGQHILRAGEKVDESTNTFYFASDYADFFIPRGLWDVTVDDDASENVIFTGETKQTAEPGGTVYFYVQPEDGYEITSYEVSRPGYVSGGVTYNKENGYITIAGISGFLKLTVKATKTEEEESDYPDDSKNAYKPEDSDNKSNAGENTARNDSSSDAGRNSGGNGRGTVVKTTATVLSTDEELLTLPADAEDKETSTAGNGNESADISDQDVPLASVDSEQSGMLALANLIAALLATVGALITIFHKNDDEENGKSRAGAIAKITGTAAAAASIVALILTENIGTTVTFTDKWTILMAILLGVQIGSSYVHHKH